MIGPDSSTAIRAPKLATVVARQIQDEVVARGWPEGEVLGSEAELLERYGVSRAVLREAVRIVEHSGAARMKRGPGGGLVIAAFNRDAVTTALSIWLGYVGVSVAEIFDARAPLLIEAMRLAASERDAGSLAGIRVFIDEMSERSGLDTEDFTELDHRFARMSGNPAIMLFVEALSDVISIRLRGARAALDPAFTPAEERTHLDGYRRLADALRARDTGTAVTQIDDLTSAVRSRLRDQPQRGSPVRPDVDAVTPKLAERVATEIRYDIERNGWAVDEVLGSEADLIERYGASRAILREAVRILEYHGAVRMKRGPGGGLMVSVPDGNSILRSALIALEYDGITTQQLLDVRSALDVAAARVAADRLTDESAEMILRTLERERNDNDHAILRHDVHRQLAVASGSRSLALFVDIVAEIVSEHIRPQSLEGDELTEMAASTRRAHERIVEAVLARDGPLAARRMLRHLHASVDVLK